VAVFALPSLLLSAPTAGLSPDFGPRSGEPQEGTLINEAQLETSLLEEVVSSFYLRAAGSASEQASLNLIRSRGEDPHFFLHSGGPT